MPYQCLAMANGSHQTSGMDIRPPPKALGRNGKGSSRRWGRNYDNRELFPLFGVSDYESANQARGYRRAAVPG